MKVELDWFLKRKLAKIYNEKLTLNFIGVSGLCDFIYLVSGEFY